VGLITKAVNKTEPKEDAPTPGPGSPESPGKAKPKRKRLVFLTAAAVVIFCSLGTAYVLFLQPPADYQDAPTRRSISSRRVSRSNAQSEAVQNESPRPSGRNPAEKEPSTTEKPSDEVSENQVEKTSQSPRESPKADSRKVVSSSSQEVVSASTGEDAGSEDELTLILPDPKSTRVSTEDDAARLDESEASAGDEKETKSKEILDTESSGDPPIQPSKETHPQNAGSATVQPEQKAQKLKSRDAQRPPEEETESEGRDTETDQPVSENAPPPPPEEMTPENTDAGPRLALSERWTPEALEASDRSTTRAQNYYRKARAYHLSGNLDKAIDFYREALTFDPDHSKANIDLAAAYLQIGRYKEAEQILVYLYALRPKDQTVLFNFALLLHRTGDLSSAQTKLEKLLSLNPFHLEANLLLAGIYEGKAEYGNMLELSQKAYQINAADPRTLYLLARAWDMNNQPAKAVDYYQAFLNCAEKDYERWKSAVRDRLNYLVSTKEER
jgi:Tfp pilus assembly protein PilF